jgi:hypothetical protein
MCRPSCCKPSGDGAGVAAVAVIIAAVFVAARIGPVVARIWHIAIEALTILTLTCAAAAAVILVTWAMTRITGSRRAHRQPLPYRAEPVAPAAWSYTVQPDREPGCLACGGTGTVLRAITASHYQAEPCPACDPAERAG